VAKEACARKALHRHIDETTTDAGGEGGVSTGKLRQINRQNSADF